MKMQEDENRRLNQALEDAVQGLQQAPTQEQLAHTLTVVRRAMQPVGSGSPPWRQRPARPPRCAPKLCRPPTAGAGGMPSPRLTSR